MEQAKKSSEGLSSRFRLELVYFLQNRLDNFILFDTLNHLTFPVEYADTFSGGNADVMHLLVGVTLQ